MDEAEILSFIIKTETEDIDPNGAAKVYAAAIHDMQPRLTEKDLRRLLLLGAAMYRNSMKGKHLELQIPVENDQPAKLEDQHFDGVLH